MHQKFHSTQTWTFKGRTNTTTSSNTPSAFPGPLDYKYDKPSKYFGATVIGKDKRVIFETHDDNPGPGSYQEKSYISDGPKRSMSARLPTHTSDTPGPTAYKPNYNPLKERQPEYSISAKRLTQWVKKQAEQEPAPNSYQPREVSPNKSVYLSTSRRRDLSDLEKTPGPTAYNSTSKLTTKQTPRTNIGSTKRELLFGSESVISPSPNKYHIAGLSDQSTKDKKGFTMRPRTADPLASSRKEFPGPGKYDVEKADPKIRGFSSCTNKRNTFIDEVIKKNINPEAGKYQQKNTKPSSAYSFGHSRRKNLSQYETTPGPAIFNLSGSTNFSKLKAPQYSMSKSSKGLKQFFDTRQGMPGPGKYETCINQALESSRSIKIPQSKWLKQGKGLDAPGVGTYKIESVRSGEWTFKKEKRKGFVESNGQKNNPGAGQYNIQGDMPNPPKYMMKAGSYKSKA